MRTYEKLTLKELEEEKRVCTSCQKYQIYLLQSYKAKIKRVEPLSEEFEETISGIFQAEKEIDNLGKKIVEIQTNILKQELYNRDIRE